MAGKNLKKAEKYFYRGIKRYKKGDYDGAIADYTRSLRLSPDNTSTLSRRGLATDLWQWS